MLICGTCLGLWEEDGQRCECRRVPGEPRWLRCDFNEHTHLCELCAGVALLSGSRWSVWFCEPCKVGVLVANRWVGWPVIPIGRHSVMNGIRLEAGHDAVEMSRFAERFGALAQRIDRLHAWHRQLLRDRLAALGYGDGQDVLLDEYHAKLRDPDCTVRAIPQHCVWNLLQHFGVTTPTDPMATM
jgi:hypothetical protein